MNPIQVFRNKLKGAAVLLWYFRHTRNWREIWGQRKTALTVPLKLRSGPTIWYGPRDKPFWLLKEMRNDAVYDLHGKPPAGAVIVDAGANIGMVATDFAVRYPMTQIFAYEPNPESFRSLQRNITGNGLEDRVAAYPSAVGRGPGVLSLWVDVLTILATGFSAEPPGGSGRKVEVPMIGLDQAWEQTGRKAIWLLKIDVEGAEAEILEGASSKTLAAVQHVIVEYHEYLVPGGAARCQRRLEQEGFSVRLVPDPARNTGMIYADRR